MRYFKALQGILCVGMLVALSGCELAMAIYEGDDERAAQLFAEGTARGIEAAAAQSEYEEANMTPENRYYVGRGVAAVIFDRFPMVTADAPKNLERIRYVNQVGQYLVLRAGMPAQYQDYTFGVIESDEPVAFSTPGGFIWVGTGMIDLCDNEDELAAVMAHEIGHAKNLHAIRQFDAQRGGAEWGAAFMGFLEGDPAAYIVEAADELLDVSGAIADAVFNNDYSNEFEFEADREAVDLLATSGYDPQAMVDILNKVKRIIDHGEDVGAYLEGHPDVNVRIRNVTQQISNNGYAGEINPSRTKRFLYYYGN